MFHKYPYSDYHEANMDWFLSKFKSLLSEWEDTKKEFTDIKDAFDALKTYVENYFDNLDVQREINNKLEEMLESGELAQILNNFLAIDFFLVPIKTVTREYASMLCCGLKVNGKNVLVDTGRVQEVNNIIDKIGRLNIDKFDYVFLTHMHDDHVGNFTTLANLYMDDTTTVYMSPVPDQFATDPNITGPYNTIVEYCNEHNITIVNPEEGQQINFNNLQLTLWNVTQQAFDTHDSTDYNDYCMTIDCEYGQGNFLINSDIQYAGMRYVSDKIKSRPSFFTATHHGSNKAFYKDFVLNVYGNNVALYSMNDNFIPSGDYHLCRKFNVATYGYDLNAQASDLYTVNIYPSGNIRVNGNINYFLPDMIEYHDYTGFIDVGEILFNDADNQTLFTSANNIDLTQALENMSFGTKIDVIINTNEGNDDAWDALAAKFTSLPANTFKNAVTRFSLTYYDSELYAIRCECNFGTFEQLCLGGAPYYSQLLARTSDALTAIKEVVDTGHPIFVICNTSINATFNVPANATSVTVNGFNNKAPWYGTYNVTDNTFDGYAASVASIEVISQALLKEGTPVMCYPVSVGMNSQGYNGIFSGVCRRAATGLTYDIMGLIGTDFHILHVTTTNGTTFTITDRVLTA